MNFTNKCKIMNIIYFALFAVVFCQPETEKTENENIAAYIKIVEGRLNQYTVQNTNLRLENVDLWKKIEKLEAEYENGVKIAEEISSKNQKEERELRDCEQNAKEKKADAKYYTFENTKFATEEIHYEKEAKEAQENVAKCQEKLKNSAQKQCDGAKTNQDDSSFIQLEERSRNCEENSANFAEKFGKLRTKLEKARNGLLTVTKAEVECAEKLEVCVGVRKDLEEMRETNDKKVNSLETLEKDLTNRREACETAIREAIAGKARYQQILGISIAVLAISTLQKGFKKIKEKLSNRKQKKEETISKQK